MKEVIVLFLLFGLNVFASLFNTALCVYFSNADERNSLDSLLWVISFILSVFVIICDVLFCVVHTLMV